MPPFLGQQVGVGLIRNLTAAQLAAENYIIPFNVQVIESDTGKIKWGNGTTAYNSLGYAGGGQVGATLTTTPVATVVINEYGDGRDMTTVLTLTDFIIGTIPAANAALGVGNIVVAFPAGAHLELVYYQSLSLKLPSTGVACDVGLGSVVAVGAVATLDGTSTFENRLTGQTITSSSTGGTAAAALLGATAGIGTGIALNVAASIKNVFLNAAGTFATGNAGSLTATGTVTIHWTKMSA